MSDQQQQPAGIDPYRPPIEFTNVVTEDDENIKVADNQTPEPDLPEEEGADNG